METKDFCSRMRNKRDELNMTQRDVAVKVGISERYYGQIERGSCSPSIELTTKIAKALNTTLQWLLNDRSQVMQTRVDEEIERLEEIFSTAPAKKMRTIKGLIVQAARLRVLLDDNWRDIAENGEYEMFSQAAHQIPYERKRPIVDTYDNRDKTYKDLMKQLYDMLPAEENATPNKKNNKARNMLLGK